MPTTPLSSPVRLLTAALVLLAAAAAPAADLEEAPRAPARAEGEGPFERLILRGVTLIDGTGAPPRGPTDIVIEGNRIVRIASVGAPGVPVDPENRPAASAGDRVLELDGHWVLPGFVDLHGHLGGSVRSTPAEYVLKLWLAHGITTISDPGSGNGLEWNLWHKAKSEANEITAPRIEAAAVFGQGHDGPITTPEQARAWVRELRRRGGDGIKFFGLRPDLMAAAIDEAKKLDLYTTCHHAQLNVVWQNALDSARMGLTSMQHWYGLPEAMLTDRVVQDYPLDYDYNDEQDRFTEAGRLWKQAAPPGSPRWNAVMDELVALDFTIVPTFVSYEVTRDVLRNARLEWHERHTLPELWRFFLPDRLAHASYYFYWGTEEEVAWKENYRLWMAFIDEFKNRGGRVAVGTDSGYSFNLYGFSFVREMELLREAGFHPLEVVRSATLMGAEALGLAGQIGTVEPGKLADLVVVGENPLANLKVLYGTGALKLTDDNEIVRVGGVVYTIKDGIVFDASELLEDVRALVQAAKDAEGFEITIPGLPY
ncbi:MAG: amidohydrolase family protein [Thermoanaerobaculia bacterium]|nr:amidohydrolase family protein [Thermoanaerobaculia bacterium]